jgi:hypothetical protein
VIAMMMFLANLHERSIFGPDVCHRWNAFRVAEGSWAMDDIQSSRFYIYHQILGSRQGALSFCNGNVHASCIPIAMLEGLIVMSSACQIMHAKSHEAA